MNVLIVAKTRMGSSYLCVGGIDLEENRSLRLLQSNGSNQPANTRLNIGEIWDIDYVPKKEVEPPHVEDVVVNRCKFMRTQIYLKNFILERIEPWMGSPDNLFDGMLCGTETGKGYVCKEAGIPKRSTGFWLSDLGLVRGDFREKVQYRYPAVNPIIYLPYTGCDPPADDLPEGTLLRVSLARWWSPPGALDQDKKCYLQLSGWYLE